MLHQCVHPLSEYAVGVTRLAYSASSACAVPHTLLSWLNNTAWQVSGGLHQRLQSSIYDGIGRRSHDIVEGPERARIGAGPVIGGLRHERIGRQDPRASSA